MCARDAIKLARERGEKEGQRIREGRCGKERRHAFENHSHVAALINDRTTTVFFWLSLSSISSLVLSLSLPRPLCLFFPFSLSRFGLITNQPKRHLLPVAAAVSIRCGEWFRLRFGFRFRFITLLKIQLVEQMEIKCFQIWVVYRFGEDYDSNKSKMRSAILRCFTNG